MDKELRKIAKSAALQNNIDPRVGEAIISSLFKQYKEVASNVDIDDPSTIQNFRIINLGIFYTNEAKIKRKKDGKSLKTE